MEKKREDKLKKTVRERIDDILPAACKESEYYEDILNAHCDAFWALVQDYHEQHCETCPLIKRVKDE